MIQATSPSRTLTCAFLSSAGVTAASSSTGPLLVCLRSVAAPITPFGHRAAIDCTPCALAKSTRSSVPKQARERTAGPLELLYSDIEGPLDPTVDGMRYAIAFVDDHSRFVWVYVLQRKSDATAALQKLLAEPDFRSILPTARTIRPTVTVLSSMGTSL